MAINPSEGDFATPSERAASRERVEQQVAYTPEMLQDDTRYAISFVAIMLENEQGEQALTITAIAKILRDVIVPMDQVMDTIDDETLTKNERMRVHLSRLVSARGRTDQSRFAVRRQQDRVLARMDAAETHMQGVGYQRAVALLRLSDLRASVNWGGNEHDAWFVRTHHRLIYELDDEISTT